MFSFKEKFKSMGSDVVQSVNRLVPLPNLVKISSSHSTSAAVAAGRYDVISPSSDLAQCGCELLSQFQNQWSLLHSAAQRNYSRANKVHIQFDQVYEQYQRWSCAVDLFCSQLTALPLLSDRLHHLTALTDGMMDECEQIQRDIHACQLRQDVAARQKRQADEMAKLDAYREAKECDLQSAEKDIVERMAAVSVAESRAMTERHHVFESLSSDEIAYYRNHGKLAGVESVRAQVSTTQLEDVDLAQEATNEELIKFLDED